MYLLEVFRLSYPDVRQFNAAVTNEGSLKPKNFCTVLSTYGLISSMSFFERPDAIIFYTLWHLKTQTLKQLKYSITEYRICVNYNVINTSEVRHYLCDSVVTEWVNSNHLTNYSYAKNRTLCLRTHGILPVVYHLKVICDHSFLFCFTELFLQANSSINLSIQ